MFEIRSEEIKSHEVFIFINYSSNCIVCFNTDSHVPCWCFLSKEVKWNVYNNHIYYGPNIVYCLDAYQTLWTSYDAWSGNSDQKHMQTFKPIRNDLWRLLPRLLILSTLGIGTVSLCILLTGSLVPFLKKRSIVLNGCRITSSVLSVYAEHYQSILAVNFDQAGSGYPEKDNISTGYYIAAIACTFYFISSIVNIVNAAILIKAGNMLVKPSEQGPEEVS
ncbi:unnamed protein product [Mytilus edulis]|uniref:Uncharacterized protein n=1 Tax=Mytilus edulis TaxID=6550 RepID=A0A8S3UK27_MYTED|nr:unnamed protein product [Mytilus edulis]